MEGSALPPGKKVRIPLTTTYSYISGHAAFCRVRLENGTSPHSRMAGGFTPAHCAAEIGKLKILKLLAEHSADLWAADNSGATTKRIAEIYGHSHCVNYIESYKLKHGPN